MAAIGIAISKWFMTVSETTSRTVIGGSRFEADLLVLVIIRPTKTKTILFWHLIQEGQIEEERTPDLRRCERIGWIRAVIENEADPRVKVWENERLKDRGPDRRVILWLDEEFLVVLGDRRTYWLLLTAYTTDRANRIEKLRREYEAYKQAGPATLR